VLVDRVELKRRLLTACPLPAPPPLLHDVLNPKVPPHTIRQLFLLAAQHDHTLRALLLKHADAAPPDAAPDLTPQVYLLPVHRLARVAVEAWLHALAAIPGRALDPALFAKHAADCGAVADAVAARSGEPWRHWSFAAGALANLGRMALDQIADDGYRLRNEGLPEDAFALIERERRLFGVDHTLAGKWLAENWGLPKHLVEAIWWHHLPPDALDALDTAAPLAEIAALATQLAAGGIENADPQSAEDRGRRLGLSIADLAEIVKEAWSEGNTGFPLAPTVTTTAPKVPKTTTETDPALHALFELVPPSSLENTLRSLADILCTQSGIATGILAFAHESYGARLLRWRAPGGIEFLRATERGGEAPPLATVLAETFSAHPANLFWVPLRGITESYGHLILSSAHLSSGTENLAPEHLYHFGRCCGRLLDACLAMEDLQSSREHLAEALHLTERGFHLRERELRRGNAEEIAAGAAQALGQPLAIIAGRAQLLLNRNPRPDDLPGLETILRESRRAGRVVQDLMQFAHLSSPQIAPVALAETLRSTVEVHAQALATHNAKIEIDAEQHLPRALADPALIRIAVQHLLRNAAQAIAGSPGCITLRLRRGSAGKSVIIQVQDTGPGVPPEMLDHIFEPFVGHRSGGGGGAGLGLALCRKIVEAHHGAIALHNLPEGGCSCTITLPAERVEDNLSLRETITARRKTHPPTITTAPLKATQAHPSVSESTPVPSTPPTAQPAHARTALTILLADRDEALRDVLAESLRSRGYQVETAPDGLEAHASLLARPPVILITELHLPHMNAHDLLREARQRTLSTAFIVLASASAPEEELASTTELGAQACLRKPFGLRALLAEIDRVLSLPSIAQGA
jgi:signal transduction histidine kinase